MEYNKIFSEEIKKKIKFIQIRTKRILSGTLIGDYSTAIKGTGHEFDQLREYQFGDDVRFVDWKSSARNGKLLIKQYFEERNRNIIIAIDISSSTLFTSISLKKIDIISQISAILTIISQYFKDNIGILIFSDKIIHYISPGQSNAQITKILKTIFEIKIEKSTTNINLALDFLLKNLKKNSIIFLLSDLIDESDLEKNLKLVSKKHELILIRYLDKNEQRLPKANIIEMQDIENDKSIYLDLRKNNQKQINLLINEFINNQNKILKKNNIKFLELNNKKDHFIELTSFFKKYTI